MQITQISLGFLVVIHKDDWPEKYINKFIRISSFVLEMHDVAYAW